MSYYYNPIPIDQILGDAQQRFAADAQRRIAQTAQQGQAQQGKIGEQGQQIGGDLLQAGLQMGSSIGSAVQEAEGIQTQAPGQAMIGDQPVYNLGAFQNYVTSLNKKDYGRGLIGQGAAQGAAIGLKTGNPLLAAGGAAIGGLVGLFGRRRARKKAEDKIEKARKSLWAAQEQFNESNIDFTQNQAARRQYEDMLDPYGLYG